MGTYRSRFVYTNYYEGRATIVSIRIALEYLAVILTTSGLYSTVVCLICLYFGSGCLSSWIPSPKTREDAFWTMLLGAASVAVGVSLLRLVAIGNL